MSTRKLHLARAAALLAALGATSCGETPTSEPVPASVTISAPASVRAGESIRVTATVHDQHGSPLPSAVVSWSSSDEAVATLDGQGQLTARAAGRATITATAGAARGTADITVEPLPRLVLTTDTLTLVALKEMREVTGTVNGAPASITLSVLSESRWNHDLPVVSVEGTSVRATGAGSATLLAHAAVGVAPDTLWVRMAPTRPYVLGATSAGPVGPGSPLVLRGYRLEGVPMDSITVGGLRPGVVGRDSASVSLGLPPIPSSTCTGGHARVSVRGADVLADSLPIRRARDGEISLAIGAAVRLTPAEAQCIRLAPGDYALAFYDAQFARESAPLPPYDKTGTVTAGIRDRSSVQASAALSRTAGRATAAALPVSHVRLAASPWPTRTRPWAVGDTIAITHPTRMPAGVVVVAVGPGLRVIAVPVGREAEVPASLIESVRAAAAAVDTLMWARMERIFGVTPGAANGQYPTVILPYGDNQFSGGSASDAHSELLLGLRAFEQPEGAFKTIAHETVHSFHISLLFRLQNSGATTPPAELWNMEGLADLVAFRAVLERFGYPLYANRDPFKMLGMGRLYFATGEIERGYQHAASWLWDLVTRIDADTDLTWQQAHDTITLATAYGRRGCTTASACSSFDGVYDVAARHLGARWDPVESVLTHTLSGAADDLTDSRVFQKPHAARDPLHLAWKPLASISGYSGTGASRAVHVGSSEYFEMRSPLAAAYGASASGGEIHWMLVRTR